MGLRGELRTSGRAADRALAHGTEPLIACSLVSGVRRQLIESGTWTDVRAATIAADPITAEWIDTPLTGEWVLVDRHLCIMRALLEVVGEESTREVGRARLHDGLYGGVLAPILRGWLRSYSSAPSQLLRVAPHVWAAGMKNAGQMQLVSSGEREIQFRVVAAAPAIVRCDAWHRFLEGYSRGFLESGSYVGQVVIGPTPEGDAIDLSIAWR